MITFTLLDKSQKEQWLPMLFDLLHANMQFVAPSGLSYEREKESWLREVSPALEKVPRQVLLCLHDGAAIGYLQYYTRNDLLVVEEIQLKKEFQRTTLFCSMCKNLRRILPEGITCVEAYADRRNLYSQKLMQKLGMENVAFGDEPFLHFRGPAESFLYYFM